MSVTPHTTYANHAKSSSSIQDNKPKKYSDNMTLVIICFAVFIANYSFATYNIFGTDISVAFFASAAMGNELAAMLQSAIVIAVGFISRPIGAWILGHYGDSKGRKPALRLSLLLLGTANLVGACLPAYGQIGNTAPVLLFMTRLAQGMVFGGLFSLGWIYAAESFNKGRLATYISLVTASAVAGVLVVALLHRLLMGVLSSLQMASSGWRFALMGGALLSLIGAISTKKLHETPLFLDYKQQTLASVKPIFYHVNSIVLTALLCLTFSSIMMMTFALLPNLIELRYSMPKASIMTAKLVGIASLAIGMMIYGRLGDKIGIGLVLMLGSILLSIYMFVFYSYLANSQGDYLFIMYGLFGLFGGVISLCPLIFVQLFPLHRRLITVGIIFNLMTILSGAVFRIGLIHATSVFSLAPAFYVVFICFCAFMVGLFVHQSPKWEQLESFEESKSS